MLFRSAAYGIPVLVVAGGWLVRYELARRGVGSTRPLPATAEPAVTPGLAATAVTAATPGPAVTAEVLVGASPVGASPVATLDLGEGVSSEPLPRRVRVFAGDQ